MCSLLGVSFFCLQYTNDDHCEAPKFKSIKFIVLLSHPYLLCHLLTEETLYISNSWLPFHLDLYKPQVAIVFVLYFKRKQTGCCSLTVMHALSHRMPVIKNGKPVCRSLFPLGITLKRVCKHSRDVHS